MNEREMVWCPHLQQKIEVHECFFCFDKHGGFRQDSRIWTGFYSYRL